MSVSIIMWFYVKDFNLATIFFVGQNLKYPDYIINTHHRHHFMICK